MEPGAYERVVDRVLGVCRLTKDRPGESIACVNAGRGEAPEQSGASGRTPGLEELTWLRRVGVGSSCHRWRYLIGA